MHFRTSLAASVASSSGPFPACRQDADNIVVYPRHRGVRVADAQLAGQDGCILCTLVVMVAMTWHGGQY